MSFEWKFTISRPVLGIVLLGLSATPSLPAQEKAPASRTQATPPTAKKDKEASPSKPEADSAKPAEGAPGPRGGGRGRGGAADGPAKPDKTAYDFELPGTDGKGVPLSTFKGKTLLIVNLGRNSSYNTQLPALQKLSDDYKAKGLIVIGVPSNEFGAAEPGTEAEIQKAYKDAKVTFPIMARSTLTGDLALPFYQFLTTGKTAPEPGPVHWNYTKFIIDKTGKPIVRLASDVAPDSPEMLSILDQILDGTYKPKKGGGEGGGPGGGGGGGEPPM